MNNINKYYALYIPMLFLITLPLVDAHRPAHAETPKLSTAVFYVP